MNKMRGFFESYSEGFDPSRMPPWLAAREAADVVVGFAVTVAVTTEVMMLAMMKTGSEKITLSRKAKPD